ncbi:EF-hand domain-containing protein [Saccharothrix stipae]
MTVVQDPYTAKMTARFATLDRDHDGRVSVTDFEEMAVAVLIACGRPVESSEGQRLLEGARTFFAGLARVADVDDDAEITEAEFVTAAQDRMRGDVEGFTGIARPWAEAVVAVADTDGDGSVGLHEWQRVLVAMGATPQRAAEQAAAVDTDGDGAVSVAEVLATAVAFYTGNGAGHEFDQA